jgi:ethanolamine utilization protein EutA (predicted chaperonin)
VKEKSGDKFEQNLDRSIVVMMSLLRKSISAKTRDLTSRSLVDNSDTNALNTIQYVSLCLDVAEQEYKQMFKQ